MFFPRIGGGQSFGYIIVNYNSYLDVHSDKKLTWARHVLHTTKLELNSRLRTPDYFLNSKSKFSLHTKHNLYKTLRKTDLDVWHPNSGAQQKNRIYIKNKSPETKHFA